jgi:hypothetical protein
MSKHTTSLIGLGFFDTLAIVFIVLKLTNYIDWSWWWVLSPLWGPFAAFAGIVLVVGLVAFIVYLIAAAMRK